MNICNLCNYSSDNKVNYLRHCKTKSHLIKEEKIYYCYECVKQYKSVNAYKNHKRNYHDNIINNKPTNNKNINKNKNIINDVDNNKLNNKINNKLNIEINNKLDDINNNINNNINNKLKDIEDKIDNSKKEVVTVVNKAINKASSLIKYLMENHRSVPPLKKITKNQCIPILRLDYKCPEKDNDYSLQEIFIRDHHRNLFIPNIAKSILKMINYQNKDIQPIYNTDSTRYNYVIKITADIWNEDKSGIKFTDYIIKPLLRYIRELIEDYIDNYLEKVNMYRNTLYENEQLMDEKEKAYTFDIALTNDYLIKPILKELSPYLRFLQLELDEIEKLEELEKIQEDLQEIINNNSDNISYDSDNSCVSDGDYIKRINKRI